MKSRNTFKKGSCEMLVLHILSKKGGCYGYEIAADIRTGIVPHRIAVAVIGVGKENRPDVTRSKRRRRHYG